MSQHDDAPVGDSAHKPAPRIYSLFPGTIGHFHDDDQTEMSTRFKVGYVAFLLILLLGLLLLATL